MSKKPENRTQELELFLRSKSISARELSRRAGLCPAAITKIRRSISNEGRTFSVEELSDTRVTIWEKYSNPWREIEPRPPVK